jgi:hypothetical protein
MVNAGVSNQQNSPPLNPALAVSTRLYPPLPVAMHLPQIQPAPAQRCAMQIKQSTKNIFVLIMVANTSGSMRVGRVLVIGGNASQPSLSCLLYQNLNSSHLAPLL